jgi:hypothetical protein
MKKDRRKKEGREGGREGERKEEETDVLKIQPSTKTCLVFYHSSFSPPHAFDFFLFSLVVLSCPSAV